MKRTSPRMVLFAALIFLSVLGIALWLGQRQFAKRTSFPPDQTHQQPAARDPSQKVTPSPSIEVSTQQASNRNEIMPSYDETGDVRPLTTFSGAGIAVNTTTVTSPTTVIANIMISPDSALGFRDVLVTTEGEVAAGLLTFQVEDSQTPVDQIGALIFLVRGLNISPGVRNALLAELNVAASGKGQSTCSSLKASRVGGFPEWQSYFEV